jgi:hypothetical protein
MRSTRLAALLLVFVVLTLSVRLWRFVDRNAVNILFLDQWDYLRALFENRGVWAFFNTQHGPHREGIAAFVTTVLYTLTAWNVRAEAFAIVVIMIMASLAALSVSRLTFLRWSFFDVWIPVVMLNTIAYEVYATTTNLAHPSLPVLLIFAFSCAAFIERMWLRTVTLCLIDSAAVFTGFGLFLGLLVPAMFLIQFRQPKERRYAAVGIVWTTAALFLFSRGYRFEPAVSCFRFPAGEVSEYFSFFAAMAAHPLSILPQTLMGSSAGYVVAVAMLALSVAAFVQFARAPQQSCYRTLWILSGFSVLFGLNAAVGRLCLGREAAQATRYIPYMVPGLLAIYIALRTVAEGHFVGRLLLLAFVLMCIAGGFSMDPGLDAAVDYYRDGKSRWAACYLQRHEIEACDLATGFKIYPDPATTHLKEKLDWLERRHLNFFK